jgi:hypothetical protein
MKKKLEADLISIAHRILQLKNKSDVNQLFLETQKLYEKLAVLRFVEEHFSDAKPTIGQAEVVGTMKEFLETIAVPEFQNPPVIAKITVEEVPAIEITEDKTTEVATVEDVKIEDNNIEVEDNNVEVEDNNVEVEDNNIEVEEAKTTTEELPILNTSESSEEKKEVENSVTEKESEEESPLPILEKTEIEPILETAKKETPKKKEAVQISFDDLLGGSYVDPDFVKVSPSDKKQVADSIQPTPSFTLEKEAISNAAEKTFEKEEPKAITLNDKLGKEISIGLNDRIAFVKHLFGGDNEDYNRVVNQLITYDNFPETKIFIDEMVKPDYNNWEGKEEYEHRFMEIVEKKFLSF